jgi:hypothetical protein
VYLIYLTACELPVHNIEYAADWRPIADLVLNACPMARLYTNCWIQEGDSETASCHDKLTDNPDSPETHQHLDYIASLIREGFTSNVTYSFNALLNDLSVKPLEQGSVQRSNVVFLIATRLGLVTSVSCLDEKRCPVSLCHRVMRQLGAAVLLLLLLVLRQCVHAMRQVYACPGCQG